MAKVISCRPGIPSPISAVSGITRDTLQRLRMEERTYGWPSEMIVKAVQHGIAIREVQSLSATPRRTIEGVWHLAGTLGAS